MEAFMQICLTALSVDTCYGWHFTTLWDFLSNMFTVDNGMSVFELKSIAFYTFFSLKLLQLVPDLFGSVY